MRFLIGGAAALGLFVIAAPALADVQWYVFDLRRQQCFNSANSFTPEQSIRGCSDIISMRTVTGDGRAQAYKLRGDRYRELRDYENALADYAQVIRNHPQTPLAQQARDRITALAGLPDRPVSKIEPLLKLVPESAERKAVADVPLLENSPTPGLTPDDGKIQQAQNPGHAPSAPTVTR